MGRNRLFNAKDTKHHFLLAIISTGSITSTGFLSKGHFGKLYKQHRIFLLSLIFSKTANATLRLSGNTKKTTCLVFYTFRDFQCTFSSMVQSLYGCPRLDDPCHRAYHSKEYRQQEDYKGDPESPPLDYIATVIPPLRDVRWLRPVKGLGY